MGKIGRVALEQENKYKTCKVYMIKYNNKVSVKR